MKNVHQDIQDLGLTATLTVQVDGLIKGFFVEDQSMEEDQDMGGNLVMV